MNIWAAIYKGGLVVIGLLTLVMVIWLFAPKIRTFYDLQRVESRRADDVRLEEEKLAHLRRQQERLNTDPRAVEKIAREEIGLAKPGELVFKFVDDEAVSNQAALRR
ncbi:MAG: septum formation initiator family protein [Kiritimatiellaeota bacterium]|nr:septum formation initiator family protein [Kiritimatiellota bacterium]